MTNRTGIWAVGGAGHHRHHHRLVLAAGAAAGLMGVAPGAHAQQWTAISLHPEGATESVAKGVEGVTQVGTVNTDESAVIWRSSGWSAVRLSPTPDHRSAGHGIGGGRQVGWVKLPLMGRSRAAAWSGTAQSWVDLHPAHNPGVTGTVAYATDGAAVVGTYFVPSDDMFAVGLPCMWTGGTASSWVSLLPAGFASGEVLGISGNQQVGTTNDEFLGKAAMWSGTAESFVDLNPPGAFASAATCTDGVHQYGVVGVIEPVPGIFAARWSGTAGSWEDMGQPEGWFGGIGAVHGGWKAGSIQSPDATAEQATVWTGGPGSYVDLHGALPVGAYSASSALGIWRHMESGTTYAVGWATNAATQRSEAMMWVTGPGVNLMTSALAPDDCSASPGDTMVYTARVINAGEAASGPVTLTVALPPAGVAAFAGSTPAPSSVTPTEVTIDLGSLAGVGGSVDVTVSLTAVQAGGVAELGFAAAAAGEVHAENNAAAASSQITPVPPAVALARAIFSTDPAAPTSEVPGMPGVRFRSFSIPAASPSGDWWAVNAATDQAWYGPIALLRSATGGTPAVATQYGAPTSNGAIDDILPGIEVNDAGVVVFAGGDDGPDATSRFVATTDGATLTEVARHGQPVAALPGEVYAGELGGSPNIFADGGTGFLAGTDLGNLVFLSGSGASIVAQRDVTVPGGSEWPLAALDVDISNTAGCQFDASGGHSIYSARLATGSELDDGVIVADGTVVLQEGVTVLPGMEAPVGERPGLFMGAGGVWMARVLMQDWQVCVVQGQGQSITRVFKPGDPIHAGATEVWVPDPVAGPFFIFAADAAGNTLVGSTTDHASDFMDSVLVYKDQAVVARENDPVDLDGDGVFDDGVYIRSFEGNSAAFVAGGVIVRVTLRGEDAALCGSNDENRGQAIVMIGLPGACPVDWNGDGNVNSSDISAFLSQWLTDVQGGGQEADFNGDTLVNSTDISAFLAAWLQAVQNGC